MKRISIFIFLILVTTLVHFVAQAQSRNSYGVYGGLNMPLTIDAGLSKDPRFSKKFTLRGTPVGLKYEKDYYGYGFIIKAAYLQIGQQYIIHNINGGDIGARNIQMDYVAIPIAFKYHLYNFSFVSIGVGASITTSYLIQGRESLTYSDATLVYPPNVAVPPGHISLLDGGVAVTATKDFTQVSHDKFKPVQLFVGLNAFLDIELSEQWDVGIEFGADYGVLDSRNEDYINTLEKAPLPPDLSGRRHDLFFSIELGVSRVIEAKIHHRPGHTKHPIGKSIPSKYKTPKKPKSKNKRKKIPGF